MGVRVPNLNSPSQFTIICHFPSFYCSISFDENLCMVTREDDPQFSSFVDSVVVATWHAEERGIAKADANELPDVLLFGEKYTKMFRDAIFEVGNYAEIYERNLARILPRGGRNMLNSLYDAGPQMYAPPGFF